MPAQNSKNTEKFEGYLFAYFEGSGKAREQEQIRFAVSENAVNWFALNQNQPVLRSEAISQTGGVRDPHILRGEDGKSFYMVATDMFTHRNGWDNNPGIVMLKSDNLLDWKHSIIDLEKLYPKKFKKRKMGVGSANYFRSKAKEIPFISLCVSTTTKNSIFTAHMPIRISALKKNPN